MSIQSLSETLSQQLSTKRTSLLRKSGWDRLMRQSKFRRRVVRYGLLSLNVVVLLAVIFFVVSNPNSSKQNQQSSIVASSSEQISSNPLDQLSSADIAAQVAQITRLPEAVAVTNQADSVNAQLAVASADDKVISKPQVINTSTKTRKDIQSYTTKSGDTIAALAGKFGVTSDSIRWSNGIYTENLSAGKQLWISPISDGVVYLVKAGDTPQSLADKFRANKDAIISFNDAEVKGLPVGERIVIPGGSQVNPVASGFSFSWLGGAAVYYSGPSNGYDFGWCTWYAATRRVELGHPVPSNLGNANTWYIRAVSLGLPTGAVPRVGAVNVEASINHVSVVEQVNDDGSYWVSEMNYRSQRGINDPTPWGGWDIKSFRLIKAVGNNRFVY